MEERSNEIIAACDGDQRTLKFHGKIRVFYREGHFGPGTATLMELVAETGSLSAACKRMNMAYSKAWKMINKAEEDLGFPLMEGRRGGERGGRTLLTAQGEDFLWEYQKFAGEVRASMEEIFNKHFDKYR